MTSDPAAIAAWWNKYQPTKDRMDVADLRKCAGMAAILDDRPVGPYFAIYMSSGFSLTTLFHESLHMAHFIMDFCEAPITVDSTETQAYLMEHIAANVLEKLTGKPKPRKRAQV